MIGPLIAQTLIIPRPEPLPLSAPVWLLWTLLMVTFLLHVIAMNFVVGGSLLAAGSRWKAAAGSANDLTLTRWFVKAFPILLAATITLGVAPLLFVQTLYGRLLYSSSVLMGWYWLSVIPLLILVYYAAYWLAFKGEEGGPASRWIPWGMLLVFLGIAFIYTNNMSLMLRPGVFVQKYLEDGRGFHLNLEEPMLLPRYLHNLVSAVAVAAMAVVLMGLARRRRDLEFSTWAIRKGAAWFGGATVVNLGIGVWYLFSLSKETLLALMNPAGVIVLMTGIAAGLVAVFLVMQAIQSENPGGLVYGALAALVVALLGMILLRDQLRQVLLEKAGFELVRWIVPDWGNILIFVALFVVALGTIAWMVTALLKGKAEKEPLS